MDFNLEKEWEFIFDSAWTQSSEIQFQAISSGQSLKCNLVVNRNQQ